VQGGRGADGDEVGPLFPEHLLQVGVGVRDPGLGAEGLDRLGIDVNGRDDLGLALLGEPGERGKMGTPADGTGADHGGPDASAGERRQGLERPGVGGLCGHGRDQHSSGDSERMQQALSSAATYAPPPQQVNTANPESSDHS
jgi:hypothetical protein